MALEEMEESVEEKAHEEEAVEEMSPGKTTPASKLNTQQ